MRASRKIMLGVAGGLAAVMVLAASAGGQSSDDGPGDQDVPITGPALEAASEAALAHLGEGRVTDTEVGDEESFYEVEVTLDDGRQVDVQLDEEFNVVATEDDGTSDTD